MNKNDQPCQIDVIMPEIMEQNKWVLSREKNRKPQKKID